MKKLGLGVSALKDFEDAEKLKKIIDDFIESGFAYINVGEPYSEIAEPLKEALFSRYPREKYYLASVSSPITEFTTLSSTEDDFKESLSECSSEYFDDYIVSNLSGERIKYYDESGMRDFIKQMVKEGRIKHLGFSFFSRASELEEILKDHPEMNFVVLPVNYADWDDPMVNSKACLEVAEKYGKRVISSEPAKKGLLSKPPKQVRSILTKAKPEKSFSSWALRYAAGIKSVNIVLADVGFDEISDVINTMKDLEPISLDETEVISKSQEALKNMPSIKCIACRRCEKVCRNNIGISGSFAAMNIFHKFEDIESAKIYETRFVKDCGKKSAWECLQCGDCEDVCPENIHIREELFISDLALNR